MIITGSQALIRALGPIRKPIDIDMFATEHEALRFIRVQLGQGVKGRDESQIEDNKLILFGDKGAIVEVELISDALNKEIYDCMKHSSKDGLHASLDWLYFLKMSHRYKKDSKHFMKTMLDIHTMRQAGAKFPEVTYELFKRREKATYKNKLPSLNVVKEDFFKKTEDFYVYDHDTIHEAVAVDEVPAYTKYMGSGAQVMTSSEKFFSISERERLLGVIEESYVLALERSLIPNDFKPDPKKAFDMALEKVSTSITGGWFREYSWENYFKVQSMYNGNYVDKFHAANKAGKIKPFQR